MVLPGRTWEELWGLYGGGPAFPRQCALTSPNGQGTQNPVARKPNGSGKADGLSWHDVRSALVPRVWVESSLI